MTALVGSRAPAAPGPGDEQGMRGIREAPLEFLDDLYARYGDISAHRAGGEPVVVVSSPELARTVLRERYAVYVKTGTPDDLMLRPLLGNGLLTSDGADWARQRRACAPAFRPATVEQYAPLMATAGESLARRWLDAAAAARTAGLPAPALRVDHDLMGLTLGVVASATLGADLTGIGAGFGQAVDAVNRYIGHVVPGEDLDEDHLRRRKGFQQGRAFLELLAGTLINARKLSGGAGRHDLLAVLLGEGAGLLGEGDGAGDAAGREQDRAVDDTELRDQVLTMVMAGHETTAKSLTWALHLLDGHPDERALLEQEVDRVLGGRTPGSADVARLPYLRAVLLESMRLYPPVWLISRRCLQDDELGGFAVPAGSLVCISPWVLHRRADLWTDPAAFRPARFLSDEGPGLAARVESHSYLPFGGGPRTCIGQHFALLEAVLVLATLVQRVRLSTLPGPPVVPEALVTLRPRDGLTMTVTARP